MVRPASLSAAAARRVALAAQGFADAAPASRTDRRHLRRVLGRIGLLQIDSVNVLVRSHYLPAYSRLGPYRQELLDTAAYNGRRELFEYWGHEASLLPVATHPLLRWRMARASERFETWGRPARLARERPAYIAEVLDLVRERGPIAASEVGGDARPKRSGPWWDWHDAKVALEWLFWTGQVTTAGRRGFERRYDLTERVLPPWVLALPTPDEKDAQRELIRIAARACGVASGRDLGDYFRLPAEATRERVRELADAGELLPVTVAGWRVPAYLWHDARLPRSVRARALLSPFDSLVWERSRTERLFGFRYRIEIYVPAPKRVHGYYVLPFLLGDRLVARVDLKSDRANATLRVQAAYAEPDAPPETAEALATQLRTMASWLGLADVRASERGNLAPALRTALRPATATASP
jgi:uncharacterized protein YcaQ